MKIMNWLKIATGKGVPVSEDAPLPISAPSSALVAVTLSLDTSAYATGDVLADTQEIAGAVRVNGGSGILQNIILNDKDDQTAAAMDIFILSSNVSLGTENSAPSITDANGDAILGIIQISAGDWIDLGGCKVAMLRNLGIVVKAASDSTSLYLAVITRGSPTQTASGITARIGVLQD